MIKNNIMSPFKDKRILVTGAHGFIGNYLVDQLIASGAKVGVIDRVPSRNKKPAKEMIGDLKDKAFMERAIKTSRPEFVFHLAATKDRSSKISAFYQAIEENLLGTLNLLAVLKSARQLRSVIVVGTAEEYGNNTCPYREEMRGMPVSSYSFSKLCVTQLCESLSKLHQIPITVIRPTLAYGPGQDKDMFLPALIMALLKKKPFPMTKGDQTRDYVYVTDLINALIKASLCRHHGGSVFNVGSGQPIKIKALAEMVAKLSGNKQMIKFGAKAYRSSEIMEYYTDNLKAKKEFGWTPKVGLKDGLRKTIEYYKKTC